MNACTFTLCGATLEARPSGALWWPAERVLVCSDLHLGKSERIARRGGSLLPPYEVQETLARLAADVAATDPAEVICLGDSFDDTGAALALPEAMRAEILALQAGRRWVWIAGNHDPAPVDLGGTHLAELSRGPLTFRHIAEAGALGEVSGHYHPKAVLQLRGRRVSRPCFLADGARAILPAYGAYTGGLRWTDPALRGLLGPGARAILTGTPCCAVPVPRPKEACG